MNFRKCKACGDAFGGDRWQQYCQPCYDTIKQTTTPAKDSKHPALVYDRQNPIRPHQTASDRTVDDHLHLLKLMLKSDPEPVEEASEPIECTNHVWMGTKYDQCRNCMVFRHAWEVEIAAQSELRRRKIEAGDFAI